MFYKTYYASPVGLLTLASDGINLIGLWTDEHKYFAEGLTQNLVLNETLPLFKEVSRWLDDYFNGKNPDITGLKLLPKGTDFKNTVWDVLKTIPYGQTITYSDLAKAVSDKLGGQKTSVQAVGGAVGHNQISIIIPCHRVVGDNGRVSAYSSDLECKMLLLEHEDVDVKKLSLPF